MVSLRDVIREKMELLMSRGHSMVEYIMGDDRETDAGLHSGRANGRDGGGDG